MAWMNWQGPWRIISQETLVGNILDGVAIIIGK
jgi:hypothetical protein